MNVFMIGNGFDLHYYLPTSYTSFLHTVVNIEKRLSAGEIITSVTQVLSDEGLRNSDRALKSCYDKYGTDYDATIISDDIQSVFRNASENKWLSYLAQSLTYGIKWVDFEQEIRRVTEAISISLEGSEEAMPQPCIHIKSGNKATEHICNCFSFFFNHEARVIRNEQITFPIAKEYLNEDPLGSERYIINKRKVVECLYNSLRDLTDMLAFYLYYFVDVPVKNLVKNKKIYRDYLLEHWDWMDTQIISFNYTNTIASIYHTGFSAPPPIHFLHGKLQKSGLVLGIDASPEDEFEEADITFLPFKKFYQRFFFQTDLSYIDFLENYCSPETKTFDSIFDLYVIGHSLDKTDREVIRDCFLNANRIFVFYHASSAVSEYIRNLSIIFGKKQLDILRTKKRLQFIPVDLLNKSKEDFDKYLKDRSAV